MNLDELKEKCDVVITEHLKTKGFPNMTRRQILDELLPMWKKLDENGLVEEIKAQGGSFQMFQDVAVRVAQETALMEKFRRVGNILKPNRKK